MLSMDVRSTTMKTQLGAPGSPVHRFAELIAVLTAPMTAAQPRYDKREPGSNPGDGNGDAAEKEQSAEVQPSRMLQYW